MFELEYCTDPERGDLISGNRKFCNGFSEIFDSKLDDLDRFIFLVDMHTIINSCADDLLAVSIDDLDDFWKLNKCLLNFVNAVYGYKEYVNSYYPPLKIITEKYYNMERWYRFICDFRNYVIHQSIIIRDYAPQDTDIFINIEEVMNSIGTYDYTKNKYKKKAEEFNSWLDRLKSESRVFDNKHYFSIKYLVECTKNELDDMKKEVLEYAYKKGVDPVLEWLVSLMPVIDRRYQYAFIVDKNNMPGSVREPNYALEDFFRKMLKSLGKDDPVLKKMIGYLEQVKYDYFYDGYCSLDDYIRLHSKYEKLQDNTR